MHQPVLLKESIELLKPKRGEFFIDGTFGGGGHTKEITAKVGKSGKVLAIDWDSNAVTNAAVGKKGNLILVNDNFARIPKILAEQNLGKADGLLLDLGFSSNQIEFSGRGFSFLRDEPLLMTYSDDSEPVYKILAKINQKELEEIIRNLGGERMAGRVARVIVERNSRGEIIKSSKELADIIASALPRGYERGRIHPATRTFQALRIYANKELENVESILKNLENILKPGGRVVIISFHSLEDRLVKNYFRDLARQEKLEILTKKPLVPSFEEIETNPRSRSAKLRGAKMTANN